MKKIFQDAVDKNVAAVMLFADASKDIFYDEAHEEPVPAEEELVSDVPVGTETTVAP